MGVCARVRAYARVCMIEIHPAQRTGNAHPRKEHEQARIAEAAENHQEEEDAIIHQRFLVEVSP